MQKLSRQVLFDTLPNPKHCKRLGKKVLGLIQAPFEQGLDNYPANDNNVFLLRFSFPSAHD